MVWKRLLVGLTCVLLVATNASAGHVAVHPDGHGSCGPPASGDLLPYGTKAGGAFFSPGMHGLRLAYYIDWLANFGGHEYQLSAADPFIGPVPDFDILFMVGTTPVLHADQGDQSRTVPAGATHAYVFLPVGPDGQVYTGFGVDALLSPATARFSFTLCG